MLIKKTIAKMSTQLHFDTKILKVNPNSIHFTPNSVFDGTPPTITDPETEKSLLEAAAIIRDTDYTVAFPTETVYGLGGSALNDEAVRNIYRAKNRPSDNPLITHVASIAQLNRKIFLDENFTPQNTLIHIPSIYHSLVRQLWPGPLTILLPTPKTSNSHTHTLSKLTTAGQPTFAVRIPSDPVARALIALSDTPIAAPSANLSTRPSPTTAAHVYHDLQGKIPLILDGGVTACKFGVESTVVDGISSPPMLLRPGGFTYERIVELGGVEWVGCKVEKRVSVGVDERVRTPGMKYKHYAPSARVVLCVPTGSDHHQGGNNRYKQQFVKVVQEELQQDSSNKKRRIAVLTTRRLDGLVESDLARFGLDTTVYEFIIRSLGHNNEEIQANLFAALRRVDEQENVDVIFVEGIPEENEGLAVMNRLMKAAGGVVREL